MKKISIFAFALLVATACSNAAEEAPTEETVTEEVVETVEEPTEETSVEITPAAAETPQAQAKAEPTMKEKFEETANTRIAKRIERKKDADSVQLREATKEVKRNARNALRDTTKK